MKLPERGHFRELVTNGARESGGWGPRAADMIEFLAYSGMRAFSEAPWVTWGDVDWQRQEIIVRGNPETGTKNSEVRRIPMIRDMEALLTRLKEGGSSSGPILEVHKCQGALTRACAKLGIPRITHHDPRHLFATRCIASGVDIPTVARWLGHKDGGAPAMKVYGHLRNQHSQEMAKKWMAGASTISKPAQFTGRRTPLRSLTNSVRFARLAQPPSGSPPPAGTT
jgi:integrase